LGERISLFSKHSVFASGLYAVSGSAIDDESNFLQSNERKQNENPREG
jgi:hypothetical protein